MQCVSITNQRAKTSHVLLTHTVNSCCTYTKVVGSHFTHINVILEHVPNCSKCVMGDSAHELPAFWSNNLLSCLGFVWCSLYGREGRYKQSDGWSFLFLKIKINQVISHGYKITAHIYLYLKLQSTMEGKQKNRWLVLLPLPTTSLNPVSFKQLKPRSPMQHQHKVIFWLLSKGTMFICRTNTKAVKPAAMPKDLIVFARQDRCVKESYTMVKDVSI